ncbi:hypothetical protein Q604_UNBC14843G0001, partial [human gut metagenome]
IITNERDMTKTFVKAAENWTRKNITEDAGKAEEIRTAIKTKFILPSPFRITSNLLES